MEKIKVWASIIGVDVFYKTNALEVKIADALLADIGRRLIRGDKLQHIKRSISTAKEYISAVAPYMEPAEYREIVGNWGEGSIEEDLATIDAKLMELLDKLKPTTKAKANVVSWIKTTLFAINSIRERIVEE